jgi:uncharacterized membrane protein YraQ (UPF0718 family)
VADCCGSEPKRRDWLLWGTGCVMVPVYLLFWLAPGWVAGIPWLGGFSMGVFELMNRMWWGLLAGILAVGLISRVPRELVMGALGRGGGVGGLLRAIGAGILLDLCSHGILLVGTQLYRRGASLGQTVAFLIASPWNSLSLTLILVSLIGPFWTLSFVGWSALVALLAGLGFERLVRRGVLPPNPHRVELSADFQWLPEAKKCFAGTRFDGSFWRSVIRAGFVESRMILRWIFFGAILAAGIRASFSAEAFGTWFGPTLAGLGLTLLATTVIEVCSEGSSPIAGDLLTRGRAPGNAFTFLMAGVATDYTEILSLRETTKSTKSALFLPLLTVPQVLLIGWLLNHFATP